MKVFYNRRILNLLISPAEIESCTSPLGDGQYVVLKGKVETTTTYDGQPCMFEIQRVDKEPPEGIAFSDEYPCQIGPTAWEAMVREGEFEGKMIVQKPLWIEKIKIRRGGLSLVG